MQTCVNTQKNANYLWTNATDGNHLRYSTGDSSYGVMNVQQGRSGINTPCTDSRMNGGDDNALSRSLLPSNRSSSIITNMRSNVMPNHRKVINGPANNFGWSNVVKTRSNTRNTSSGSEGYGQLCVSGQQQFQNERAARSMYGNSGTTCNSCKY